MIYTASYFQPANHHGKLVSISRGNPKDFSRIPRLPFFAPSKELLAWWKKSAQTETDWEDYKDRFYEETLDANCHEIDAWLKQQHRHDITLLCWETSGEHCHRNDVGELIANRLPQFWGGFDIPQTPIEQVTIACQEKGLAVTCDRLSFENDFSVYHVKLGKKDLGQWTETGVQGLLSQLLNPTNPAKWFKESGIDLDAIGYYSLSPEKESKPLPILSHDNQVSQGLETKKPLKVQEKNQSQTQTVAAEQLALF